MTTDRFTQCPHCKASFKVSGDQLAVANGRVRCGACMNIFDAIAYSVAPSNSPGQTPDKKHPSDGPPVDLEDTLLTEDPSQYELEEEDQVFQDDPEEDSKENNYSGGGQFSDELSTSFIELDQNERSHDPYKTEIAEVDAIDTQADESWTREVLEDAASENGEKIEPHISAHTPEDNGPSQFPDSPDIATANTYRQTHQRERYDSLAYAQQDESPKNRHWLAATLFALLNLTLLLALLGQASWFHYEKLAKYPQIARLYEQACALLKCQLPALADISKINSHNLIVRSHPTTRKALIIDTIIINDADYPQAFPDIALYFSNINNQTIAQRLIHPQEYLSGELLTWHEMPSRQPIHIAMEILDPGSEAVNYTLKFFAPQAPETPSSLY